MKDHVDNLDSMAQLEVIPTPAKTEEELEQNLAAIEMCGYNTGSVKWLYGTKNCKVVNLFTAQNLIINLFSNEGPTVIAYTLVHVLYSAVEKNLSSKSAAVFKNYNNLTSKISWSSSVFWPLFRFLICNSILHLVL